MGGALAVFARVEPAHKTRLVELLKAQVGGRGMWRAADAWNGLGEAAVAATRRGAAQGAGGCRCCRLCGRMKRVGAGGGCVHKARLVELLKAQVWGVG